MAAVTPPGIPVLMPGEGAGAPDGPLLRYLTALEAFDRRFPGFRSETHGVTLAPETGDYLIECVPAADGPAGDGPGGAAAADAVSRPPAGRAAAVPVRVRRRPATR